MTEPLYMLDTDICIFLLRKESPELIERVQSVPLRQQVISAVTLAELTFGVRKASASQRKQNQTVLDQFTSHLAVLDWPQAASQSYAEIRLDLEKRGKQIGAADLMIAAHAHTIGATVVTNNIKDFSRVKGLRVENWKLPNK